MSKQSNDDDWVTLSTFTWLQEALVLKGMLESDGIESYIPEQFIGTINPAATGMTVRLQVKGARLIEAQELLNSFAPDKLTNECPNCGTELINRILPSSRSDHAWRNWLNFIIGFVLMIPFRRQRSRKFCANCEKS